MDEVELFKGRVVLEKFQGKGGWTYAPLPGVLPDRKNHFGWVKARGTIDDYAIKQYHLMPMGNGRLFLPVKAEIRKKIKKQAGDEVYVRLFADDSEFEIPADLLDCLRDEPVALEAFIRLSEGEKRKMIQGIYSLKKESTRAEKIATVINSLAGISQR